MYLEVDGQDTALIGGAIHELIEPLEYVSIEEVQ